LLYLKNSQDDPVSLQVLCFEGSQLFLTLVLLSQLHYIIPKRKKNDERDRASIHVFHPLLTNIQENTDSHLSKFYSYDNFRNILKSFLVKLGLEEELIKLKTPNSQWEKIYSRIFPESQLDYLVIPFHSKNHWLLVIITIDHFGKTFSTFCFDSLHNSRFAQNHEIHQTDLIAKPDLVSIITEELHSIFHTYRHKGLFYPSKHLRGQILKHECGIYLTWYYMSFLIKANVLKVATNPENINFDCMCHLKDKQNEPLECDLHNGAHEVLIDYIFLSSFQKIRVYIESANSEYNILC